MLVGDAIKIYRRYHLQKMNKSDYKYQKYFYMIKKNCAVWFYIDLYKSIEKKMVFKKIWIYKSVQ